MTFINKFKYLVEKSLIFGKYSLHLNFGPFMQHPG
jgi:hypothetical protein